MSEEPEKLSPPSMVGTNSADCLGAMYRNHRLLRKCIDYFPSLKSANSLHSQIAPGEPY